MAHNVLRFINPPGSEKRLWPLMLKIRSSLMVNDAVTNRMP